MLGASTWQTHCVSQGHLCPHRGAVSMPILVGGKRGGGGGCCGNLGSGQLEGCHRNSCLSSPNQNGEPEKIAVVPVLNWTPGSSCLCQTTVSWCQEPHWVGPNLPQGGSIQTQPASQASLYLLILPPRKHPLLRASGCRPCRARLNGSVPGPDLAELPKVS